MADVFISYSRKDKDFVRRLYEALAANGRDTWVDWEDIPLTAQWRQEIRDGIAAADTFVFVISPDSARSQVCLEEIQYAVADNKRIVPLMYRELTDVGDKEQLHPAIGLHNWIFFENADFDETVKVLLAALDTDLALVREHTRLLLRAREWDSNHREASYLLGGEELRRALAWLSSGKDPQPTDLHREYIQASSKVEQQRRRRLFGGAGGALVALAVLAIVALVLLNNSRRDADVRESLTTAQSVQTALENGDIFASISLALDANAIKDPPAEAQAALLRVANMPGPVTVFGGDTSGVSSLAFAPDGVTALVGYEDGSLRFWDVTAPDTPIFTLENAHPERVNALDISPDGLFAASVSCQTRDDAGECVAGDVSLWRMPDGGFENALTLGPFTSDGYRERVTSTNANDIAFDPTPNNVALELIVAYDGADGPFNMGIATDPQINVDWTRPFSRDGDHNAPVTALSYSTDGQGILSGDASGRGRWWDSGGGNDPFPVTDHADRIVSIVFSPQGSSLADRSILSASWDGTVMLSSRNQPDGFFTFRGHQGAVNDAVFDGTGSRAFSVGADGKLFVIDVDLESSRVGSALYGFNVSDLALTAVDSAGSRLLTGAEDGTLVLWDTVGHDDDFDTPEDAVAWVRANRVTAN